MPDDVHEWSEILQELYVFLCVQLLGLCVCGGETLSADRRDLSYNRISSVTYESRLL